MALYEMRTYTLYVGKMAEATKLYQDLGFPALKAGGHDKKLLHWAGCLPTRTSWKVLPQSSDRLL